MMNSILKWWTPEILPVLFSPTVEIKKLHCYDWWKKFFDRPVKSNWVTYENIQKIATGQGDDYSNVCLLDYNYFKVFCKIIAVDLSKQQALDADPKLIQQIDFNANLDQAEQTAVYFIIEETRRKRFRFFTRNCWNVVILFCFDII